MPKENVSVITAEDWGREIARGIRRRVSGRAAHAGQLSADPRSRAEGRRFPVQRLVRRLQPRAHRVLQRARHHVSGRLHRAVGRRAPRHVDSGLAALQLRLARGSARDAQEVSATGPPIVLMHGANPGLVSHLLKQALLNLAATPGTGQRCPTDKEGWARLAMRARREGGADRRARPPGRTRPQAVGRVRQHLVERRVRRRVAAAGRARLGHARAPLAARGHGVRLRLRLVDLSQPARVHHARALLGADRRSLSGLADLARRVAFDPGLLHGARERQGRCTGRPAITPIIPATMQC